MTQSGPGSSTGSALQQAENAALSGRPEVAQACALIAIAQELHAVRRELEWQRRHASRETHRG